MTRLEPRADLSVGLNPFCRANTRQFIQACLRPEVEKVAIDVDYLLSTSYIIASSSSALPRYRMNITYVATMVTRTADG